MMRNSISHHSCKPIPMPDVEPFDPYCIAKKKKIKFYWTCCDQCHSEHSNLFFAWVHRLRIKWLIDGCPPVGTKLNTQSNTQLHPLTDEEILELWVKKNNLNGAQDIVDFAKAILRKAEK